MANDVATRGKLSLSFDIREAHGDNVKVEIMKNKVPKQKIQLQTHRTGNSSIEHCNIIRKDAQSDEIISSKIYRFNNQRALCFCLLEFNSFDGECDADISISMSVLPIHLLNMPFFRKSSSYSFWAPKSCGLVQFLARLDARKTITLTGVPLKLYDTRAFRQLKDVKVFVSKEYYPSNSRMTFYGFVYSDAEILHVDGDIAAVYDAVLHKLHRWATNNDVVYQTFTVEKIYDKCNKYDEFSRNAKKYLPIIWTNYNYYDTHQFALQRRDGTVAEIWCRDGKFEFHNRGIQEMKPREASFKCDVELPYDVLLNIATYFDIKTQRRFAQCSKMANEIATKSNRVSPCKLIICHYSRVGENNEYDEDGSEDGNEDEDEDDDEIEKVKPQIIVRMEYLDDLKKTVEFYNKDQDAITEDGHLLNRQDGIWNDARQYVIQTFDELGQWAKDGHVTVKGLFLQPEFSELYYFKNAKNYHFEIGPNFDDGHINADTDEIWNNFLQYFKNVSNGCKVKIETSYFIFDIMSELWDMECIKKVRKIEIEDMDCGMSDEQFINSTIESLEIESNHLAHRAFNLKIKEWFNFRQNYKGFAVRIHEEFYENGFNQRLFLRGIQYSRVYEVGGKKIPEHNGYSNCLCFKIKRQDGKVAHLLLTEYHVVFQVDETDMIRDHMTFI